MAEMSAGKVEIDKSGSHSDDREPNKGGEPNKRKEIYTYEAPWTTYALSWNRVRDADHQFRLAVGSFKEEYR